MTLDDLQLAIQGKKHFQRYHRPYPLTLTAMQAAVFARSQNWRYCFVEPRIKKGNLLNAWHEYCAIVQIPSLIIEQHKRWADMRIDMSPVFYDFTEEAKNTLAHFFETLAPKFEFYCGLDLAYAYKVPVIPQQTFDVARKILTLFEASAHNIKYWRRPQPTPAEQRQLPAMTATMQAMIREGVYEQSTTLPAMTATMQAIIPQMTRGHNALRLHTSATQERKRMSVQLYKDGQALAIQTDCVTEETFVEQFCELLTMAIDSQTHAGEWEFHLRQWLPQFVELCCAYRGYKAKVSTKTVYTAGELTPGEPLHHVSDVAGVVTNGVGHLTVRDKQGSAPEE